MRFHRAFLFLSLAVWAFFGSQARAAVEPPAPPEPFQTQSDSQRLVIFEGFLLYGCMYSASTGPVIDQLASEYAGQPVIFLEYPVDSAPESRLGRWFASAGSETANLPLTMVDSGEQIYSGYYAGVGNTYREQVNYALTRPPLASLQAYWTRVGNQAHFSVTLTNQSGVTLSKANSATLHAIVYEESHIQYTGRFVRSAVAVSITSLANGATAAYTLQTSNLSGVDWSKLHYVVLADYRPSGSSGGYDMLQAAVATGASVEPDELVFMVDPGDSQAISQAAQVLGGDGLSWTAAPATAWISATPGSGTLPTQPTISVDKNMLSGGWQTGSVSFSSTDGSLNDTLTVKAYLGALERVYLPVVTQ